MDIGQEDYQAAEGLLCFSDFVHFSTNYRKVLPWPEFYGILKPGMGFKKYKYYFTKPRSEIGKDFLRGLLIGGALCVAATSPCFIVNLLRGYKKLERYPKRKVSDTFYNLKRQGLINVRKDNHQIYICLTERGKRKAGWLQIDNLKIEKPRKWDGKWRLAMFDIAQIKRLHREAFRGKLRELGFCPFQKSVWIHPFNCKPEIELLQKFFGLSNNELRLVIAEEIGEDARFKKIFHLA